VFSNPNAEFVDGGLYLFVMDAVDGKLTMPVRSVNKSLIGTRQIDAKDENGKAFKGIVAQSIICASLCSTDRNRWLFLAGLGFEEAQLALMGWPTSCNCCLLLACLSAAHPPPL
jgi:hypothetical protein